MCSNSPGFGPQNALAKLAVLEAIQVDYPNAANNSVYAFLAKVQVCGDPRTHGNVGEYWDALGMRDSLIIFGQARAPFSSSTPRKFRACGGS